MLKSKKKIQQEESVKRNRLRNDKIMELADMMLRQILLLCIRI